MIYNMKKVSELQLAYLAGFVDGEGHITALKTKSKRVDWNDSYSPDFGLTNTNREILEHVRKLTGFGNIKSKSKGKPNWKPAWELDFDAIETQILLERLLPYLIVKKRQAELLLELMNKKMKLGSRRVISVDEQVEKDLLYEEIRELNKRGV